MSFNSIFYIIEDAAFPTVFVLFLFSLFNYGQIYRSSIFRFLTIGFVITFVVRLLPIPSGRYDIPLALYFISLSVFGIPCMVNFIYRFTRRKIAGITGVHITIFLFLVIAISCIGKALSSPDPKSYIKDVVYIIKTSSKEPVLLFSDAREMNRIAYSSGASKYYMLSSIIDPDLKNLDYALNCLEGKNLKPYIMIEQSDTEFRNFFISRNMNFPLKLVREFRGKRDKIFSVYEYDE